MTRVDTLTPIPPPVLMAGTQKPEAPSHPGPHPRLPLTVVRLDESTLGDGQCLQYEHGDAPRIGLVLEGSVRLVQDGRESLITAGQVFLLKPRARQSYTAIDGPVRQLHLILDGLIAEQMVATLPDHIIPRDPSDLRTAFTDLLDLFHVSPSDHHVRASTIAYRLLLGLSVAQRDGERVAPLNPQVAAALRILHTSGARDLDIRQVARTVGTSVSHLHRLFKDALGTSPLRYAREHLIAQAKDALDNTTLSCQEIAKRLGYDDPLYFSAVFKRIAGVSPRAYRKQHR